MSIFWNKRTAALSPYVPGEQPGSRKFIKLNTNENPYPPSPRAAAAIEQILAEQKPGESRGGVLRLYPDPLCGEFRTAAAAAHGVKPEQVFPGNGSDEVLAFAFGAFFESGEKAGGPLLFPDITYSFYPVYAGLWDIPYKTPPLRDDFSIALEDYTGPSRGVIIANPNAPTGRVLPPESLRRLAETLEERRQVLILDEAYVSFGAESLDLRIKDHPNLLVVHTLSKSAALAGLRIGYAIGNEALIEGLFRVRDSFNSYTMDRLALAGGTAAISDGAYYRDINKKVIATRERTAAALKDLGFTVIPSAANFLFTRPPEGTGGAGFFQALRNRGILVRRFATPRIADYLRVSIGTDEDMDAFLEACRSLIVHSLHEDHRRRGF
ncbi:MAG: aminotransferase class I/II-fold pyridoxal phosphate-dependent enzyme [Treponema sp.]|nr:aminotransferase class I/II-fold pyridoxal phosphate-dependent enzyme [Treponema sp.]